MKKTTLLLLLIAFCWQTNAQIYIEENLDSGFPTDWTQSSYYHSQVSTWLCEGTGNVYDNMYGSASNDGTITSKNYVGISNGTDTTVTFEWLSRPYSTNAVDYIIYVEYSTDDGVTWNSVSQFAVTTTTSCTTYSETIPAANLPSNSDFKFQIRGEWQSGDSYFYLDNIIISQTISCPQPSDLTATDIIATEATLGWTENGSASLYYVEVVAAGATPTGTATDTGVANPFTKTSGLAADTNYEYYVQADCTGGDLSAWVGPFAFRTACVATNTPYSQNFDTFTVATSAFTAENCWTGTNIGDYLWEVAATTDTSSSGTGPGSGISNGNYLFTESTPGSTGDIIKLASPLIDLSPLTAPSLSFDYHMFGTDMGTLRVIVSEGGTHTTVETITGQQQTAETDPFETRVVNLSAYVNKTIQITFEGIRGADYTSDMAIDTIIIDELPSCVNPSNLTATGITATQATLGWTEMGSASLYNVEVVTAGATPSGTATDAGVSNPFIKTGLTADTNYEYYVQADCTGGDLSTWTGPFAFTTPCVNFTPEYNADMSNHVPTCWNEAHNGDATSGPIDIGSGLWYASNHGGTSSNAINIYSNTRSDWIISPIFDLSTAAPSELNIYVALTESTTSGSGADLGSDDAVSLLMTTDGGTTWTSLQSWTQGNVPTDIGEEISYDLSAITGTVQFAFLGDEGSVDDSEDVYFHVSKFQIRETPSCNDPSNLTATGITASQATLGWTENGSASLYNVEVVTAGTPPTGTATDAGVTNNPFTKTGLTSNTNYEYYVQADCTGGDLCPWVGPFAFTTLCDAISTFPWSEDFESITVGQPTCWSIAGTTTTASYHFYSFATGYSGRGMRFDSYYNSNGNTSELTTPLLDLSSLSSAELNFWYKNPTGGNFEILISTDAGSNFSTLETGLTGQSTWLEKTIDITSHIDSDVIIQFKGTSNYGSGDARVYLDEVSVREIPSCIYPSSLTATGITATQATLGWTENGSASLYNVEVVTAGTPPTGTATDTGVNNPFTKMGLTSSTNYEYYVQADCTGGDLSPWAGPFAFTTSPSCGETVYDSGGATGNYGNNESTTVTVYPDNAGDVVTFTFNSFRTKSGYDFLRVYNGPDVTSPLLGSFSGSTIPDPITSTHTTGALTFVFVSDGSSNYSGYEIIVSCSPPMGLKDNALEGVSIVPNPVTTILKFNATEKIQQISVFNLLGQEVKRITPNAVKTELSVENLQTGMYLVKVKIGEQFGVYKILKD